MNAGRKLNYDKTTDNRGVFVTGTNTEVGKTYVSSLLAQALVSRGLRVGVYKPVASGCAFKDGQLHSEDAEQLWVAAGKPLSLIDVTPQRFAAPLAPNVAARNEGRSVDPGLLRTGLEVWNEFDFTIVEGVGGLLSPISDDDLVVDLAADFGLPILVVVANGLGCINHTLLTLKVAQARGLLVAGLVLNSATTKQDDSYQTNQTEIERWSDVPVVACVRWDDTFIDLSRLVGWLPQ